MPLSYIDGKTGFLFFEGENGIVYRSLESFKRLLNPLGPVCFEWEIFGLTPARQPWPQDLNLRPMDKVLASDLVKSMIHPENCVMDINATFENLKYKMIDKSIISNLRARKKITPFKNVIPTQRFSDIQNGRSI